MLRSQQQPDYLKQFQNYLLCPITLSLLQRPVTLSCGHSFQATQLEEWRNRAFFCPLCKRVIRSDEDTRTVNFNVKRACTVYTEELARKKLSSKRRFQVFVKAEKTITVEVGESDSVDSLMIKVALKRHFDPLAHSFPSVLYFAGKKLQLGFTLNDYGIQPQSTLQCIY